MTKLFWLCWISLTIIAGCAFMYLLFEPDTNKQVFLPGPTTAGHYQIELACSSCHSSDFADAQAIQDSCENCHADALKEAKDDHPKSKFTDPRNADRIAVLDARFCASCHVEHRPEITSEMGLTVPEDFCILCHEDIADDRPSHAGMEFTTCASSGCHNFHDNRALYEDFLIKHLDDAATVHDVVLPGSNFLEIAEYLEHYPTAEHPITPLQTPDWPAESLPTITPEATTAAISEWHSSGHATAGVNCSACHQDEEDNWITKPTHDVCATCHKDEVAGFLQGKHGMRLDAQRLGVTLAPMTPGEARLPMHPDAHAESLSCQSCHQQHNYDTKFAAVEACLGCHADDHSKAFKSSPHFALLESEKAGTAKEGSGVTCATCHMPRVEKDYMWGAFTHNLVQHNQSATLRPNEKMLRPICLSCHGLEFSIDALADRDLINKNFNGKPNVHVESMDLAKKRL